METAIYSISGLYRDNGKKNGNYYIVFGGYRGILENRKETAV